MSFTYQSFPDLRLKHGTEKTINDPVAITSNGNREIRRKLNKVERYSWSIPSRNLYQEDADAIVKFFNTVHSSVDSFLFRDPTVPELTNQQMVPFYVPGTPGTWLFGLYHSGMHPVLNLGNTGQFPAWDLTALTNIVVKRNGVPLVYGSDYDIHMNFDMSPYPNYPYPRTTVFQSTGAAWTGTDVITFSGPIYHTVRFDGMISYKITAMKKSTLSTSTGDSEVVPTVSSLSDIKLIEVFEYQDET